MATSKSVPVLREEYPYVIKPTGEASRRMELEMHHPDGHRDVCHFVADDGTRLVATVQEDELYDVFSNELIGNIYATTDSRAHY